MRTRPRCDHRDYWHDWYAWFPVLAEHRRQSQRGYDTYTQWVWLETVRRRHIGWDRYEYHPTENTNA